MGGEKGAAEATMTTKKKKKGRPSLLELQKRSLKQQQQLQHQNQSVPPRKTPNPVNPNSPLNSARRNPNLDGGPSVSDSIAGGDDDDERQQKKHKLLLGLNSSFNHQHYPFPSTPDSASYRSDSDADGEDPETSLKRRKVATIRPGSDQMGERVSKATYALHGSPVESGPTTPLPDKKLLVFILDRLQKKDTYGVFSEPVNPEELPDYHEIIAHPMDFSTVRKKLDDGAYTSLEQFEKDIFLICSNAMEYNASDTIYFRQARSMQELAKKDFENLRQDSDEGEPQPKVVRRGRPPGKSLKKSLESSTFDRVGSEFSSDATLATEPDASRSKAYNLRKGPSSHKPRFADPFISPPWGSHSNDNYSSWLSELENEFPASVVRAVTKYGKKHFMVDENRRDTYNLSCTSGHEQPIFSTLDGELKQLIPVGLSAENGYATSLSRFAADLGPVVWKIASKKIESVLPRGVKFGPGWVGENKMIEQSRFSFSKEYISSNSLSDNHSSRLLPPSTPGSNSIAASRCPLQGKEDAETVRGLCSQNDSTSAPSHQFQQRTLLHPGIKGSIGDYSSQTGLVVPLVSENTPMPFQQRSMVSGSSSTMWPMSKQTKFDDSSSSANAMANIGLHWKPDKEQDSVPFPPDLNVRFLAPGSPSSSLPIGSPQRPDLALQL
ncbi:hypothetical protein V6N13_118111 [Hibiscus sabdariffa]